MQLTREEWIDGALYLSFVAAEPDADRRTEFRITDIEPRLWWVNGIDGVTTDVRTNFVVVRMPRVSGHLEFTPSSY